MPETIADATTMQLIEWLNDCEFSNRNMVYLELKAREIKENDPEDAPDTRGGIRPKHHSIVP